MGTMPEPLRQKLLERGYKRFEIGDAKLHLSDGKITRIITADGRPIANPVFPDLEIDWEIIAEALP